MDLFSFREDDLVEKVKIITDSACDLPIDLIREFDIEIIKIPINDGKVEYVEHETIHSDELFKNMVNGVVYKTSQIASYDLKNAMEKYVKQKRPVVVMSLSSGITGGYHAACVMANEIKEEYRDSKVYVCDSFCATAGQALAVLRLAKMADDGLSFEEIVEAAEFYKMNQDHLWTITNFEYLVRGGRLSKGKAMVGGMLNIRPVMEMNKTKGTLEPIDKVRGEKALIKAICDHAQKRSKGGFNPNQTLVVTYAANKRLQEALYEEVRNRLKVPEKNIKLWQMGCVVGSYIGPDYTGLFYLSKLRGDKYDICL